MKEYILPIGGEDMHTIVDEMRVYREIVGEPPNIIELDQAKFNRIMANSEMGRYVYHFNDPEKCKLFGCKVKINNNNIQENL
jgi:hypothetical protein